MKTQRALILPVLFLALIAQRSESRAQVQNTPTVAPIVSGPKQAAPHFVGAPSVNQVPLGVRSSLNAPEGAPTPPWAGGMVMPAGYDTMGPPMGDGAMPMGDMGGPMMGDPNAGMMEGPMGGGYETGAYDMGGYGGEMYGDEYCPPEGEHGFDLLGCLLPYPGGGWCSPRWFDVAVEGMYLAREDVSRTVDLISDGPAGLGAPLIVLSTDDLDFDERPGFRFIGAVQIGSSSAIEFNYFGTFNWAEAASVSNSFDELFSVFSDFGTNPPPQAGPPIVLPGFTDTDNAEFASIEYSSTFDSLELDFRRRWMAPNCRFQGSWLAGVRYFRLEEDFVHRISVNRPDPNGPANPDITGFLNYRAETANSMTGFQAGGDAWVTLFPGVQVGTEGKIGIYGNRADQHTVILAQSLTTPVDEFDSDDDVAFLGEAALLGTWRLSQHVTLRGGYEFLYVDGVALAPENFNAQPPFIGGARTTTVNDNGDVLYHGFAGGLEYMW